MENRIEETVEALDGNRRKGHYKIVAHVIGTDSLDNKLADKMIFVVMADAEENDAFSITNNCERVATAVLEKPLFPGAQTLSGFPGAITNPSRVIWAEYYPDRGFIGSRPQFKESFALITFRWDLSVSSRKPVSTWTASRPVWSHTTRKTVEALLKQPFEISGIKV